MSNAGRLCWNNKIADKNISVTTQELDYPGTNMLNPSTAFPWEATATVDHIISVDVDAVVDFVGIARHNLRQSAEIKIELVVDSVVSTLIDWANIPDRQTLLYLFDEVYADRIQVQIRNNDVPPSIAVLYIGESTPLQRNIYVGHTPVTYGRTLQTVGGYSENGQYIGEVVRREGKQTSVSLQNLTPDWYRANLDPFISQRPRLPAFFSWRPDDYPDEVGFVWLTGSPQPVNQRSNGMMEISMQFEALA